MPRFRLAAMALAFALRRRRKTGRKKSLTTRWVMRRAARDDAQRATRGAVGDRSSYRPPAHLLVVNLPVPVIVKIPNPAEFTAVPS